MISRPAAARRRLRGILDRPDPDRRSEVVAPNVTVHVSDALVPELLHALAPYARGQGDLRLLAHRATGRSQLYFLGDDGPAPTLVAKLPLVDADSEHPPLDAQAQFDALRRAHGWFKADDTHAVAEPVACLPELGCLVMRHAAGPTVASALAAGVRDPSAALAAARAAGDFLRRFHEHAAADSADVDLRELADELLQDASEVLPPLRLRLPAQVRAMLGDVAPGRVRARRVLRHGDYVGANLIVTGPRNLTMIDPALSAVGLPEDDMARFLAHLSSTSVFMVGGILRPVAWLRRQLEDAFLAGYGPRLNPRPVLGLRLLRQHVLRWARRTEIAVAQARGPLLHGQRLVIDAHIRGLLQESRIHLQGARPGVEPAVEDCRPNPT